MDHFISGFVRVIGSLIGILFVTMPSIWVWWFVSKHGLTWMKPYVTDGSLPFFMTVAVIWLLLTTLVFTFLNLVFWKFYNRYGSMLADKIDKVIADG